MKFLVDTADVAEIKDLAASGLLGRVEVVKETCAIVPRPVSAEMTAVEHKKMLDESRKLTMTDNGLKAFLDGWAMTGQSIL
jgi:transaldolase